MPHLTRCSVYMRVAAHVCVCVCGGESNVIAGNCIRDECANILELYLTIRSMEVGGCVWVCDCQ